MSTPTFAAHNAPDACGRNSMLTRKRALALSPCMSRSDSADLCVSEFRARVALANETVLAPTPLVGHVFQVVGLSTKPKMVRANAPAVVTVMQHETSVSDWTVGQFPRDAVCGRVSRAFASQCDLSISIAADWASPFPAVVTLLHSRPEPILKRFECACRLVSTSASARTEPSPSAYSMHRQIHGRSTTIAFPTDVNRTLRHDAFYRPDTEKVGSQMYTEVVT